MNFHQSGPLNLKHVDSILNFREPIYQQTSEITKAYQSAFRNVFVYILDNLYMLKIFNVVNIYGG